MRLQGLAAETLINRIFSSRELEIASVALLRRPPVEILRESSSTAVPLQQGELGVIRGHSVNYTLGTHSATTCLAVILHPEPLTPSSKVLCAHVDTSSACPSGAAQVLAHMNGGSIVAHFLGSYDDVSGIGRSVLDGFVTSLNAACVSRNISLRVATFAVGPINTTAERLPIRTGLAVQMKRKDDGTLQAEVFAADFKWRGPERAARLAVGWVMASPTPILEVFDGDRGGYSIPPMDVKLPFMSRKYLEYVLALDDEQLKLEMSTSPDAEDDEFASDIRDVVRWILQNIGRKIPARFLPISEQTG